MTKVLFVTHDSNRTGAPLFFLNFLTWLRKNHSTIEFDILIYRDGELEKEFKTIANATYRWHSKFRFVEFMKKTKLIGKRQEFLNSLFRNITAYERKLLSTLGGNNYSLVFINSFACAPLIPLLATHLPGTPFICRPPELKSYVKNHIGIGNVAQAIPHIDQFIAVSDLVAHYLNSDLNIQKDRIVKIPGFIRPNTPKYSRTEIRRQLKITDDAFLVCACGTLDWRKGADLFVQIAAETARMYPERNIKFCWIGGNTRSELFRQIQFDLDVLKLPHPITFIASTDVPFDYFCASDLFALTSREDPFPLVALEAAACGLPIICFDASVGSKEFVTSNTGRLIPYLDISSFAETISNFQQDNDLYDRASINIKALSNDYSVDKIGSRLLQLMVDTVAKNYQAKKVALETRI